MKRLDGWRAAFVAAIDAHRPFPFAWGTHDCAILTADCILAVTGEDVAVGLRGRYDSARSGAALLAARGQESAADLLADRFAEIHPSQAIAGDVAVIKTRHGPATAPVIGADLAAYAPAGTLGAVPLTAAIRAFRIEI